MRHARKTLAATTAMLAMALTSGARAEIVQNGEMSYTTSLDGVIANGSTRTVDPTNFANFDGLGDTSTGGAATYATYAVDGTKVTGPSIYVATGTTAGINYNSTPHNVYTFSYGTLQRFFGGLFNTTNQPGQTLTFSRAGTTIGSIDLQSVEAQSAKSASIYAAYLNVDVSGGYDQIVASVPAAAGYRITANSLVQSTSTQNLTTLSGVVLAGASDVPEPGLTAMAGLLGLAAFATKRIRSRDDRKA